MHFYIYICKTSQYERTLFAFFVTQLTTLFSLLAVLKDFILGLSSTLYHKIITIIPDIRIAFLLHIFLFFSFFSFFFLVCIKNKCLSCLSSGIKFLFHCKLIYFELQVIYFSIFQRTGITFINIDTVFRVIRVLI